MQFTLKDKVIFEGKGLHSGQIVTAIVIPASANEGIHFIRDDLDGRAEIIPARYDHVTASQLCTLLKNDNGVSVSTIEHIMAAFAGMGIDNATIILNGPEMPIMDGSAMPFIKKFQNVGLQEQNAPRRLLRILKPVEIRGENGGYARIEPDIASVYDFTIDFDHALLGRQNYEFELRGAESFISEIAECRTFTRLQDVEMLQQAGLIKGGGLDNAVVFDRDRVLNPEGLRHTQEAVRHKILDAIGDLYLAGAPIIGRFTSEKGGHAMTNQLLRKLFATEGAFAWVTSYPSVYHSDSEVGRDIRTLC